MKHGKGHMMHGQPGMNMVSQIWTWLARYEHGKYPMNKQEHCKMNMVSEIWKSCT